MNTGGRTTYIFLERGVEDNQLLREINKVFAKIGNSRIKTMAKEYPKLLELKQELEFEVNLEWL